MRRDLIHDTDASTSQRLPRGADGPERSPDSGSARQPDGARSRAQIIDEVLPRGPQQAVTIWMGAERSDEATTNPAPAGLATRIWPQHVARGQLCGPAWPVVGRRRGVGRQCGGL